MAVAPEAGDKLVIEGCGVSSEASAFDVGLLE